MGSQPDRLTRPGAAAGEKFGSAVAVGLGGTQIFVGAPNATTPSGPGSGDATVFDAAAGTPLTTLVPPVGAMQGAGAAIAVSDELVVVGAPMATIDGRAQQGRAIIYDVEGSWSSSQTQPDGAVGSPGNGTGDQFGTSLALTGTGLVVGVPSADVLSTAGEATDQGRVDAYSFDRILRGGFEGR